MKSGTHRVRYIAAGNHAAAQADIALIQHCGLPWRHCPLRLLKHQFTSAASGTAQFAGSVKLPVTGLGGHRAGCRRGGRHPTAVLGAELGGLQPRVLVALHHPQGIGLKVLAGDKPRRVLADAAQSAPLHRLKFGAPGFHAANAQALALAERVKRQAHMLAQNAALVVLDRAGCLGNVAVQELAERSFANEADAGGVFFLRVRQSDFVGNAPYIGFAQLADREQCFGQLRLVCS